MSTQTLSHVMDFKDNGIAQGVIVTLLGMLVFIGAQDLRAQRRVVRVSPADTNVILVPAPPAPPAAPAPVVVPYIDEEVNLEDIFYDLNVDVDMEWHDWEDYQYHQEEYEAELEHYEADLEHYHEQMEEYQEEERIREASEAQRAARQEQIRASEAQRAARVVLEKNWDEVVKAYQDAYALVLEEKWNEARQALEAFVRQYSGNRYIDDARFWICYAMEKSDLPDETVFDAYYQFILEFDTSKWTNDAKANLISIGRSLVEKSRKNRAQYGPILEQLQKDYDLEVAVQALYGLRRIGDASSLKAVLKLYDRFEDKEMRKKVVVTLGYFDDPSVVDELHRIALNDSHAEVRQVAISTLSRHDGPEVLKVMEALLKSAEDADERRQVVIALRRVGGDEVVPILLDVARNDVHVKVRTEAVATLSRLGTPKAQEALIELLEEK